MRIVPLPKSPISAGTVQDNPGARKQVWTLADVTPLINLVYNDQKRRVGRGEGSGLGKTSGRGQKGYLARSAKTRPIPAYEGGQTGLLKAIPKFGFRQSKKLRLARLHLDTVQHWIDSKRLDPSSKIGIKQLVDSRCVGGIKDGVVLLAKGGQFLTHKIDIEVTHASQEAIRIVENLGGTVTCFDYDRKSIRALLRPELFLGPPKPSFPTDRGIHPRYFDTARRGYLVDKVSELMKKIKGEQSAKESS